MVYAYPNGTVKLVDIAMWSNSVTSGFFWPLILFAIFCILFMSFLGYGATKAFTGSSFIVAVLSIMMATIGLISTYVMVGCFIMAAIALICMYLANHREF
jgi:hypothetical protein